MERAHPEDWYRIECKAPVQWGTTVAAFARSSDA